MNVRTKYTEAVAKALSESRPQIMLHVNALTAMNDPTRPKVMLDKSDGRRGITDGQPKGSVASIDIQHFANGLLQASVFDMEFPIRHDAPMPDAHISWHWSGRPSIAGGDIGQFVFLTKDEKAADPEAINPGITSILSSLDDKMAREVHLFGLAQLFRPYFVTIHE